MNRLVLVHHGQRIVLPFGESYVGRSITCRVRFNDPAVSRRHLRLLVMPEGSVAENLSATNGTYLNGERIVDSAHLKSDDELQIGHRYFTVKYAEPNEDVDDEPVTVGGAHEAAPGLLVEDETLPEEATRPAQDFSAKKVSESTTLAALAETKLNRRNCPKCRSMVMASDEKCSQCGWPVKLSLLNATTQQIVVDPSLRRTSPRFPVRLPVVYSSEFLTLDAVVRDISLGGMFIATELLDPVGTECRVTVLPDGYGALSFAGLVCHASTEATANNPPGIGVRFVDMTEGASYWLDRVLKNVGELNLG